MLRIFMFFSCKPALAALLIAITLPVQAGVLEWLGINTPAKPPVSNDFLSVEQAFILSSKQNTGSLQLSFAIAPGYYLYRHTLAVSAENAHVGDWSLPEGTPHEDEYFGKTQVYYQQLALDIPLDNIVQNGQVAVRYQGCTTGLCYPPQTIQIPLRVKGEASPVL